MNFSQRLHGQIPFRNILDGKIVLRISSWNQSGFVIRQPQPVKYPGGVFILENRVFSWNHPTKISGDDLLADEKAFKILEFVADKPGKSLVVVKYYKRF